MSNGHAAFKLVLKLVLFCKTLEGCYSMSNSHAVLKIGQFSLFLELSTKALILDWKEYGKIAVAIVERKAH